MAVRSHILDLVIRKVPNLKKNHARVFLMPILVRNDTLFVLQLIWGQRYEHL